MVALVVLQGNAGGGASCGNEAECASDSTDDTTCEPSNRSRGAGFDWIGANDATKVCGANRDQAGFG